MVRVNDVDAAIKDFSALEVQDDSDLTCLLGRFDVSGPSHDHEVIALSFSAMPVSKLNDRICACSGIRSDRGRDSSEPSSLIQAQVGVVFHQQGTGGIDDDRIPMQGFGVHPLHLAIEVDPLFKRLVDPLEYLSNAGECPRFDNHVGQQLGSFENPTRCRQLGLTGETGACTTKLRLDAASY